MLVLSLNPEAANKHQRPTSPDACPALCPPKVISYVLQKEKELTAQALQIFLVMKTWNVNLNWWDPPAEKWFAGMKQARTVARPSNEFRLPPWAIQIHNESTKVRHSIFVTDKMDFGSLMAKQRISLYFAPSRNCNSQKVLTIKMSFTCPTTLYLHRTKGKSKKAKNPSPSPDGSKTSKEKTQQHLGFLTVAITATQQPPELLN